MADPKSSPDWLPAGWTVDFKVRKNGKKDKCYTNPSNELKFYSKLEVLRYLNNIDINSPRSKEKIKGTRKRSAINFVVEKAVAEGLPPGWIKEMRVKKKGRKTRRDPYYIDPVSGYVFRSMKDVVRYLKTGELGRLASKPKDKGCINVELGDNKFSSPAESERQKLADSGADIQVTRNQNSTLGVALKDGQILEFDSPRDSIPFSERTSDQCREGTAMSSAKLPEATSLEQSRGKGDSSSSVFVSAPIAGALPEKLASENGAEKHGNKKIKQGMNKLKDKKGPDLPRRASKRLAGVEINSLLELETNNRARRVAARRSGEAEDNAAENSRNLATPEEQCGKLETEITVDEKQGCSLGNLSVPLAQGGKLETEITIDEKQGCSLGNLSVPEAKGGKLETEITVDEKQGCSLGNLSVPEAQGGQVETDNKGDEKRGSPLDFSLRDSWMDPCIEFAVKTLTGAIPIGDKNEADGNPGSPQNLPDENPGSPLDLPFGDFWTDPCIEFAVKTLTGEIPVGDDLGIQSYFQQPLNSPETKGNNDLMPPSVSLDNFCQTNLSSQKFHAAEKPLYTQEVTPSLPHASNVCFQISGDTGLHHVNGRS